MEESMSDSKQNIEIPFIPTTNTEDPSTHPQSTIETFIATPSIFRRASASPPASLTLASAQFLADEINRSVSLSSQRSNNQARDRIVSSDLQSYPPLPYLIDK